MRAIKYNFGDHYKELERWWNEWPDWSPLPAAILPDGFVIKADSGELICAGFMYRTEKTPVCAIEWVVKNPKADKKTSDKGLDLLFEALLGLAKVGDLVLGWAENDRLIKRYESHGFKIMDTKLTSLHKPIWKK